jgi:uncharacterized protein YprB with RNaseH-like and TPR domain
MAIKVIINRVIQKEIIVIRHTFSLLNGIGEKLERNIWTKGILTWKEFWECKKIEGINPEKKRLYDYQLLKSYQELENENSRYFTKIMNRKEHWRLFDSFKNDAVCLDIETTGYQPEQGGYVTVVGLYDGHDYKYFIKGENLTTDNLNRALSGYKYLITFHGSVFDIPFLLRTFPNVRFDIPHFDLCIAARKLKINLGLKKLETLFGINRDENVKGLDGYAAVRLWDEYKKGSLEARELLLKYNKEDTINLLGLAEILYQKLKDSTGINEFIRYRDFTE